MGVVLQSHGHRASVLVVSPQSVTHVIKSHAGRERSAFSFTPHFRHHN